MCQSFTNPFQVSQVSVLHDIVYMLMILQVIITSPGRENTRNIYLHGSMKLPGSLLQIWQKLGDKFQEIQWLICIFICLKNVIWSLCYGKFWHVHPIDAIKNCVLKLHLVYLYVKIQKQKDVVKWVPHRQNTGLNKGWSTLTMSSVMWKQTIMPLYQYPNLSRFLKTWNIWAYMKIPVLWKCFTSPLSKSIHLTWSWK